MPDRDGFVDHTGEFRKLGLRPPPRGLVGSFPPYGDGSELVPEAQWKDFQIWTPDLPIEVKNQGQTNSCAPHAGSLAVEQERYGQGAGYLKLDPWTPYAKLCQGSDDGSSIIELLHLLMSFGIPPDGTVPHGTIDPSLIPAGAAALASRFRVTLGQDLTTREQIASAVMRHEPIVLSVCVGPGFDDLDAEGVPNLSDGQDNHAVNVWGGLKWSSRRRDHLIFGWNSWGPEWGERGHMWLPLSRLATKPSFSAFRLKAALMDPRGTVLIPGL